MPCASTIQKRTGEITPRSGTKGGTEVAQCVRILFTRVPWTK